MLRLREDCNPTCIPSTLQTLCASLPEIRCQFRRVAHTAASARWHRTSTIIGSAVVGTRLRASGAVEQRVTSFTRVARVADKDASFHVGDALWGSNLHATSGHVNFARHIDGRPGAGEGELAPSVAHLAVDELRVAENGGPGAGLTVGERHNLRFAGFDDSRDMRWDRIHPGALRAPDDENDGLAGVVDKVVRVGAAGAEPYRPVVGCRVRAWACETKSVQYRSDVVDPGVDWVGRFAAGIA